MRYGLTFPSFGSVLDNAYGVIGNMVGFWLDTIENLVTQLFGIEARTNYDDGVDASASTELATAAFRMGHTLLQGLIRYSVEFQNYVLYFLNSTRIQVATYIGFLIVNKI